MSPVADSSDKPVNKVAPPFLPSIQAQSLSRYTSEILWHFVSRRKSDEDSYQILLGILKTGLKVGKEPSSVILYRQPDGSTRKRELYGYPVSCLADIPLKDLPLHIMRYGCFAIGFHKVNAIYFGFNPIMYINQHSKEYLDFMATLEELGLQIKDVPGALEKYEHLRLLFGTVVKGGYLQMAPHKDADLEDQQLQCFYYEREWRCTRDWSFKSQAVGVILLPDDFIAKFKADSSGIIAPETVVLPASMVLAL